MMEWGAWKPIYEDIVAEFGYDVAKDREAAHKLRRHIPASNTFGELEHKLAQKEHVAVVGCGPSLDKEHHPRLFRDYVTISSDGATTRLRQLGIIPDIIMTDLDIDEETIHWARENNCWFIVHASSENLDQIDRLVPHLGPYVFGTYQCAPEEALAPLKNFGGFTDGDRAVLMCEGLGLQHLALSCFDFDRNIDLHTPKWDDDWTPKKLRWTRRLIAEVHGRGHTTVEFRQI